MKSVIAAINVRYVFWIAISIGCVLRFVHLDAMEFKADEFRVLEMAYEHLQLGEIAQHGIRSSIGLYNPPMFIWFLSFLLQYTTNPVLITASVATVNVLAVGLLYMFAQKHFDARSALFATALVATSPWCIIYSRKLWAQDLLFPVLMALYILLFSNNASKYWITIPACFVLASLAVGLHLSSVFILPAVAVVLIGKFRASSIPAYLIGFSLCVGLFIPYIYFQSASEFSNIVDVIGAGTQRSLGVLVQHIDWYFSLPLGLNLNYMFGNARVDMMTKHDLLMPAFSILRLSYVLLIVSTIYAAIKWKQHSVIRFFVSSTVSVALLYYIFSVPSFPHYGIVLFPIAPVLLAYTGSMVPISKQQWVTTAMVIIVIAQTQVSIAMVQYLPVPNDSLAADYGVPYNSPDNRWRQDWEATIAPRK